MKAGTLVALISLVLIGARPATALTLADCELWISQAQGEADGAAIGGEESAEQRKRLVEQLDQAARDGRDQKFSGSIDRVTRFQKQTRELASEGKLSGVQADRLFNIGEAARRCLEQVR